MFGEWERVRTVLFDLLMGEMSVGEWICCLGGKVRVKGAELEFDAVMILITIARSGTGGLP